MNDPWNQLSSLQLYGRDLDGDWPCLPCYAYKYKCICVKLALNGEASKGLNKCTLGRGHYDRRLLKL
jgi:hypothetical protein